MSKKRKGKNPTYSDLSKILTDEEIVDAYVLPSELSEAEQREADEEFRRLRLEQIANLSDADILFGKLVKQQLSIKKYLDQPKFDPNFSFGAQLKEYIRITGRSQKTFSEEVDINKSTLNRIINGKESPSIDLMYRIEKHSDKLLEATIWYGLLFKQVNNEISINEIDRKKQYNRVKEIVNLRRTG